jgi:hypothetical protein
MADEEKDNEETNGTPEVPEAPEAVNHIVVTRPSVNEDDAGEDITEEQPQKTSRISRIFAAIPKIPEYPIARPAAQSEQDAENDPMEVGFGADEDGVNDLVSVDAEAMDDMVGTSSVIDDDVSDITDLSPQDADFLYGTGPTVSRIPKKTKYSAGNKKTRKSKDTDTYMSGVQ